MKKNTSWKFTDELSISGSGEFGLREIQLLPPLSFVPLNGYWLFSAKPTLFIVFVSSLILYTTHWTEIVAVSFLLEKLEIDLLPEACQVFGLQPFSGLFSLKRLQVPVNLLKRSTNKIYPQYKIDDGENLSTLVNKTLQNCK